MLRRLRETMGKIADELLERSRQVKDGKEDTIIADKSIIGILGTCLLTHVLFFSFFDLVHQCLVKSENAGTQLQMTSDEVLAQMVGGSETPLLTEKLIIPEHTLTGWCV